MRILRGQQLERGVQKQKQALANQLGNLFAVVFIINKETRNLDLPDVLPSAVFAPGRLHCKTPNLRTTCETKPHIVSFLKATHVCWPRHVETKPL